MHLQKRSKNDKPQPLRQRPANRVMLEPARELAVPNHSYRNTMAETKTLLVEENLISLRTAIVLDDGNLVSFRLLPRCSDTLIQKDCNFATSDHIWLYRHERSVSDEVTLTREFMPVEQAVRPMVFTKPHKMELLWADSGESVALLLNGEPWAFIHEEKHNGYSKGILRPSYAGNPWNQELFEKTFKPRNDVGADNLQ
jgi:hypothetical protein